MKNLLFVILCVLIAAVITGCGEVEEAATTEFTADAVGTIGAMKMDAAPAAPSVPTDGTPFVKSVGYYSDWQLTEQLADGAEVPVGTLVYIHIQFSEPMAHRNTDNEEEKVARPILYYWVNSELIRFRVMPHGSQGDDFVSGDAKPKGGGTDDYVGKYRVRKEHEGSQFWVRVGKWSVDLEGNPLADSYTHKEKLRLGEKPEEEPEQVVEEPAEKEEPEPIEISYYADWNFTEPIIEEVSPGDTIHTKVVFAERVPVVFTDDHTARPAIFYTVGGRESQYRMKIRDVYSGDAKIYGSNKVFLCIYTVRQQDIGQIFSARVGEISGGLLTIVERKQPITPVPEPEPPFTIPEIEPVVIPPRSLDFYIHGDGTSDRDTEYRGIIPGPEDFGGYVLIPKFRRQAGRLSSQPIAGVMVTITAGPHAGKRVVTDENGQYIFKGVREETLHLRVEGEHLETKEVIVYRSGPTALVDGTVPNHYGDPQRIPGNILVGQRWPDAIRPLLQQVPIVYDHLFIVADLDKERTVGGYGVAGLYNSGVVIIGKYFYVNQYAPTFILKIFAHEIAHMRQHAIVSPDGSGTTDDWVNTPEGRAFAEARQKDWDEFGKTWLDDPISHHLPLHENAAKICAYYWLGDNRIPAPNRYKWAEEWLK